MLITEDSTSYLMAIESLQSLPTRRTTSSSAKILHVLDGAIDIETLRGPSLTLLPGMAVSLGAGEWCSIRPRVMSRTWTVYAEEHFLRSQMGWLLPDASRVLRGHHPDEWDGRPLALSPGREVFAKLEPLWREISRLHFDVQTPEAAATRAVELLARWVRIVTPTFLKPDVANNTTRNPTGTTGLSHHDELPFSNEIERAVRLLRERMTDQWTVTALAREVSLSRTHLTRLFTAQVGIAPIRFLTEIRTTEFTRLVSETHTTLSRAAAAVGWEDPRVAAVWFQRRNGELPSQFRRNRDSIR